MYVHFQNRAKGINPNEMHDLVKKASYTIINPLNHVLICGDFTVPICYSYYGSPTTPTVTVVCCKKRKFSYCLCDFI